MSLITVSTTIMTVYTLRRHYGRGNAGGTARDVLAALGVMVAGQTRGGTAASDWRRETKEERAEWAAKIGWAGFRNQK
jgi:hypothetical protein